MSNSPECGLANLTLTLLRTIDERERQELTEERNLAPSVLGTRVKYRAVAGVCRKSGMHEFFEDESGDHSK